MPTGENALGGVCPEAESWVWWVVENLWNLWGILLILLFFALFSCLLIFPLPLTKLLCC
jgi:hypothetical protein